VRRFATELLSRPEENDLMAQFFLFRVVKNQFGFPVSIKIPGSDRGGSPHGFLDLGILGKYFA